MFCNKCGRKIQPNAKFCPECGAPQFGDQQPDSEFMEWRKKRLLIAIKAGIGLIIVGLIIKNIQISVIGAFVLTVGAVRLNKLNKK